MRLADIGQTHPVIRDKALSVLNACHAAGLPLEPYECLRTPFRQAALYALGRSSGGRRVTRAQAWHSKHQFGFAVDMVFRVDGRWSWAEPETGMWARYHEAAKAEGLVPLSFEMPHIEAPVAVDLLRRGEYPDGGDRAWSEWLEQQIEIWGPDQRTIGGIIHPGAPPPLDIGERPGIV